MITGYFGKVEVPTILNAGNQVEVIIRFDAINPGAKFWTTWLHVHCAELNLYGVLDGDEGTVVLGQNAKAQKKYYLGVMPKHSITITLDLFASDLRNLRFTEADFMDYYNGETTIFEHIATAVLRIEPGEKADILNVYPLPPEKEEPKEEVSKKAVSKEAQAPDGEKETSVWLWVALAGVALLVLTSKR